MLLEPGRIVGAYEILGPLGQGGMGEVYRARDTRLGRLVALKIVSADLHADPAAAERFEREARLASSLNHPAIVSLHDVGRIEGRPFIVMELVEGQSLSARLEAGPLRMEDAVDLACQVADGLVAAHEAGIVHRDLKPRNICLTGDRRAKIVDFGLSKLAHTPAGPDAETTTRRELTAAHTVLGSVGYMAPEQVSGAEVTFRADQFALGTVMYEMLTGRRAFKRDTDIQTLAAIMEDAPASILESCPQAPPRLVTIIDRCLAKRPEDRYGSTRDLARDLREVRDGFGERGRSPVLGAGRFLVGRRRAAAVLVAALGALAVLAYVSWKSVVPAAPDAPAIRRVVVLPFTCPGTAGVDRAYCDGLVETLTADLAVLQRFDPTLRVVSQVALQRDRASAIISADAARRTVGATVTLTGAVHDTGSGRRITLQQGEAPGGRAQTIDVAAGEEAAMRDGLVTAAAAVLDLAPGSAARAAITAAGTTVSAAYLPYVLGRGYLHGSANDHLDLAIGALSAAVMADPRFTAAHTALCDAYWRQSGSGGDEPAVLLARASCRTALQIDEQFAPVHVTLARIARGQRRYEEAQESAKRAIALDPAAAEGYQELAATYEATRQWSDAEAAYAAALQARPDDPQIYSAVCRFHLVRAEWATAETRCRHALHLTPDNTRALNNLGAALLALRRIEEAAAMFHNSLQIRPTYPAASNLGYYAYSQGRYADAARAYEQAAILNASDPEVWRNLGAALFWAPGERAKAREAYQQVVTLVEQARAEKPGDARLLGQLADAYAQLGRAREARETLATLERLDPGHSEVLYLVAGVYEQLGDRTQALTWLEQALDAGYSRDQVERSPFLAELRKDDAYPRLVK